MQSVEQFVNTEASNLSDSIENFGISLHFIPANSPHFDGLWEAGVKLTKYHLKRVAGNSVQTYEKFYTLLVEIEALLNFRPLTPMPVDPSDLVPLTPAHFLIGRPLYTIADPDLKDISESKLSHWQLIQKIQQHFWERWNKEYISELQQRNKWTKQA